MCFNTSKSESEAPEAEVQEAEATALSPEDQATADRLDISPDDPRIHAANKVTYTRGSEPFTFDVVLDFPEGVGDPVTFKGISADEVFLSGALLDSQGWSGAPTEDDEAFVWTAPEPEVLAA